MGSDAVPEDLQDQAHLGQEGQAEPAHSSVDPSANRQHHPVQRQASPLEAYKARPVSAATRAESRGRQIVGRKSRSVCRKRFGDGVLSIGRRTIFHTMRGAYFERACANTYAFSQKK